MKVRTGAKRVGSFILNDCPKLEDGYKVGEEKGILMNRIRKKESGKL